MASTIVSSLVFACFSLCGCSSSPAATTLTSVQTTPGLSTTSPVTIATTSNVVSDRATSSVSSELDLWDYLPGHWSSFCSVDYGLDPSVNATIKCHVTPSEAANWRLTDLRASLAALANSSALEVAVNIQCETGGTVSLPFPYRSPGLVKLTVFNCRLLDKFGDFGTPAARLEDWLREADVRNCVWVTNTADVDRVAQNPQDLTSHYDCGQDSTLVSLIDRNNSDLETAATTPLSGDLDLGDLDLGDLDLGDLDLGNLSLSDLGLGDLAPNDTTGGQTGGQAGGGDDGDHGQAAKSLDDYFKNLIDLSKVKTSCLYEQLEVMDESYSPTLSRTHFEFMVMNSQFPKLRVLNYTSVGMTEVPQELRESRRKFAGSLLGIIDLSHNKITQVGEILPYPSYGIHTTLIIRFNNITDISFAMFRDWAKVPDYLVDIRNNPIDCSCNDNLKILLTKLQNLTSWKEFRAMEIYRRHLSVLACATPPELAGRMIGSLTVDDLPCPVQRADLRPAMVALGVIVIILLVLLVLAVKYRKEVRILMYTRVHILLPCGPPVQPAEDSPEKMYDAFVSYAHQDSDWVLDLLLKRLEEPGTNSPRGTKPVKLCIHQRDFVVGKPIIDNIIDCIAASRHTIVILSKNFVKSSWSMEELQQAYRQSLEERRRHLVMVVLEDVAQADMAPVLRRCCKTFTYLDANDPLFWDRLLYSIHVDDKNNKSKSKRLRMFSSSSNSPSSDDDPTSSPSSTDDTRGKEKSSRTKSDSSTVEEGISSITKSDDIALNFDREAVFLPTMRTVSVDSVCTTVSETGVPVTPSQFAVDRPLFKSHA